MGTSVRTDEHREGVLVPAHYKFVDVLDLYAGTSKDDVTSIVSTAKVPLRWAMHAQRQREKVRRYQSQAVGERCSLGQCNICGAHIRYAVVWAYSPVGDFQHSNGYITTGTDCAASVNAALESEIARRAGALKEFVAGMRRSAREAEKAAQAASPPSEAAVRWSAVDRVRQAWIQRSRDHYRVAHYLHAVSTSHAERGCSGKCFHCDVTAQLVETGTLSDRQVAAIMRSVPTWERTGNLPDPQILIPSGVTVVTGTLVSAKHGRMLIQCAGYRVWTVPPEGLRSVRTGTQVRFVAYLTASERDAKFLIASDVRDGEVVG